MSSRTQRHQTSACLEDDNRPAATPPQGERAVVLDSLADFASEEALPPRIPRKNPDDAALDAFELEATECAGLSIPASTSTAATFLPADADGDRRDFVLPAWRSMAAAAGIVGVIALGLLVKQPGHLPLPDAARSSAPATAAETRPPDPPATTASPQTQRPALPIEVPAEPGQQLQQNPAPPQVEQAGAAAINGLAARATDEGLPSPSATTGNVMASNPSPTIDAGIGVLLPAAAPVPEIPPANLPAPSAADDDTPPLPAGPALPSAQDQVSAVLGQFQAAYSRLDAGFVQAIWPSVDRPRLERAFRNLASQDLEFGECRLDVASATAAATCTGAVNYVTRVGSRRAHDTRTWTFTLRKAPEGWRIQDVLMR